MDDGIQDDGELIQRNLMQDPDISDDFVIGEVINESTDVRSEYTESTA